MRLLVVDDSILNRKLLEMMLQKAGVDFSLAAGGGEALQLLAAEDFDMVWTDIDMPFMSGLELAQRIQTLPDKRKSAIPLIAITGNVLDEQLLHYRKAGMKGHILKPYNEADIREVIQAYYSGSLEPAQL